jgi:hypothetical protein
VSGRGLKIAGFHTFRAPSLSIFKCAKMTLQERDLVCSLSKLVFHKKCSTTKPTLINENMLFRAGTEYRPELPSID